MKQIVSLLLAALFVFFGVTLLNGVVIDLLNIHPSILTVEC